MVPSRRTKLCLDGLAPTGGECFGARLGDSDLELLL